MAPDESTLLRILETTLTSVCVKVRISKKVVITAHLHIDNISQLTFFELVAS